MATQTVSQFNDALNVNLTSAWCMSKAVIRGMIRQRRGAIVHVGSVVGTCDYGEGARWSLNADCKGEDGQAGQIAYSTAKGWLRHVPVFISRSDRNIRSSWSVRCDAVTIGIG